MKSAARGMIHPWTTLDHASKSTSLDHRLLAPMDQGWSRVRSELDRPYLTQTDIEIMIDVDRMAQANLG